jgi:hypothetical protein
MSEISFKRGINATALVSGIAGIFFPPAWIVTASALLGKTARYRGKSLASEKLEREEVAEKARKDSQRTAERSSRERIELRELDNLQSYHKFVYDTEQREITKRQAQMYTQADSMLKYHLNSLTPAERARVTGYKIHEPRTTFFGFGKTKPLEVEVLKAP